MTSTMSCAIAGRPAAGRAKEDLGSRRGDAAAIETLEHGWPPPAIAAGTDLERAAAARAELTARLPPSIFSGVRAGCPDPRFSSDMQALAEKCWGSSQFLHRRSHRPLPPGWIFRKFWRGTTLAVARNGIGRTHLRKRLTLSWGLLALVLASAGRATAVPILDFTGGIVETSAGGQSVGWEFTVVSPIPVDGLGLFDVGANGFANGHELGLWNGNTQALLASVTIETANSMPVASTSLVGNWRFTPISELTLAPGDYVLGAVYVGKDQDRAVVQ